MTRISSAIVVTVLYLGTLAIAQTAPGAWARVELQKVAAGMEPAFEALMKDAWQPAYQAQKTAGRITHWVLYRVRFTGASDEYNYAAVSYYDSWAGTAATDSAADLLRASSTRMDPAIVMARTRALATVVRRPLSDGWNS